MIKIEEQTVTVKSGIDGKGAIALHAEHNTLSIRELINDVQIREAWEDSDVADIPKIIIQFNSTESVDAFIRCLEAIKRNLENPYGLYPFAC